MGFNIRKDLVHSDCLDLFGFLCDFDEDLGVEVVVVVNYILLEISDQEQYINTLFEGL